VEPIQPVEPRLELIGGCRADLGEPLELGHTPWGRRPVIPILGGEFDGPRVSATILAGGADWQVIDEDGMAAIDTRYTLRTRDEALTSVATRGVRHGPPDVLRACARGSRSIPPSITSASASNTRRVPRPIGGSTGSWPSRLRFGSPIRSSTTRTR